ncbi:MAG: hypothetical protein SP1CHLAM54_02840 [Chlamydiia bacterium]|nr:hypothetical protein [Chlamydiia bacterium]MCH9615200.1 hypothetical protein [Chlamydiia bacterium]MCH9628478.1 hypothetical protein [Chlamydiia bacterium]
MRIEPASGGTNIPHQPVNRANCGKIVDLAHHMMEHMPTPREGFTREATQGGLNSAADAKMHKLARKTG